MKTRLDSKGPHFRNFKTQDFQVYLFLFDVERNTISHEFEAPKPGSNRENLSTILRLLLFPLGAHNRILRHLLRRLVRLLHLVVLLIHWLWRPPF